MPYSSPAPRLGQESRATWESRAGSSSPRLDLAVTRAQLRHPLLCGAFVWVLKGKRTREGAASPCLEPCWGAVARMQSPPSQACALPAVGVGTGLSSAPRGYLSLDSGPKGRREARERQHHNKSTNSLFQHRSRTQKPLQAPGCLCPRETGAILGQETGQCQGEEQGWGQMGKVRCQGCICSLLCTPWLHPGLWWGLGCLEGPRLLERARTCPRSDSGSQYGNSSGGRTAGVAEGHRLQDQHGPSAGTSPLPIPAPNPRGVSPYLGWGQSV